MLVSLGQNTPQHDHSGLLSRLLSPIHFVAKHRRISLVGLVCAGALVIASISFGARSNNPPFTKNNTVQLETTQNTKTTPLSPGNNTLTKGGKDMDSSSNNVHANVTVNGQNIPVPANGSVHRTLTSNNGQTSVNVSTNSNGDASNNSSSSLNVNISSDSSSFSSDSSVTFTQGGSTQ